ncbi:MAG: hypothetical protein K6F64_02190 [Clostridia bacterium]|nr:hypothetical protein [Clostridia bacterium]
MSNQYITKRSKRFIFIIISALAGGIMWQFFTVSGFGFCRGLVCTGTALSLLVYAFFANGEKFKYEFIFAGSALMAVNITDRTGDIIHSLATADFESAVWKLVVILLVAGFTAIPLYSLFIGTLFSSKNHRIFHYAVTAAVYVIVNMISEKYVSALAVKSVFGDTASVPLPVVEGMSLFIALAVSLVVFSAITRDGVAILISLAINFLISCCLVLTGILLRCFPSFPAVSYFITTEQDGFMPHGLVAGAIIGFSVSVILFLMPDKFFEGNKFKSKPYFKNRNFLFICDFAGAVILFGVLAFRSIGFIAAEHFKSDIIIHAVTVIGSLIIAVIFFAVMRKNLLRRKLPVPFAMKPREFAQRTAPLYILTFIAALLVFGRM